MNRLLIECLLLVPLTFSSYSAAQTQNAPDYSRKPLALLERGESGTHTA
jgi:hypothetical protein